MSDETRINGKVWKKIQASQDWSDMDTWLGMIIALTILGLTFGSHYFGWIDTSYYNTWN